MLLDRKAVAAGALLVASAIGGTLALASGCTVLTNDAPPDDAGLFEGGDAHTSSCDVCLSAYCAAPQAVCLTNAACVGVLAAPDSACTTEADGGPSPERLYHAYTSCNDAKLATCANDCAALNRAPSTLPACASADDGGITDAGDASDGGDADAGEAADATSPDAGEMDAGEPPPGPDACVACAAANCSAAASACASATECGQFLACASACKTPSCVDDCATQHATGKVAASELATCTASNCQKSCEL